MDTARLERDDEPEHVTIELVRVAGEIGSDLDELGREWRHEQCSAKHQEQEQDQIGDCDGDRSRKAGALMQWSGCRLDDECEHPGKKEEQYDVGNSEARFHSIPTRYSEVIVRVTMTSARTHGSLDIGKGWAPSLYLR